MFIAYAQKPPENVHAGVSSGNIGLIVIWVFIYIHTLCMLAVKAMARMRICAALAWAFIFGLYDMCQNLVSLPNNITFVHGTFVQKAHERHMWLN